MKKHYVLLIGLLIAGCFTAICLYKEPTMMENTSNTEAVDEIEKGEQTLPTPPRANAEIEVARGECENHTSNESETTHCDLSSSPNRISDMEADRLLKTFEEFAKVGDEIGRVRRLRGLSEEKRHEREKLEGQLWGLCLLLMDIARDDEKRGLLNIFRKVVDYNDGELRLPVNSREYWVRYNDLCKLIKQPSLTDVDMERIKQLIQELNESAKTNAPTSIFQAPKNDE